jgi:mannosyltransferase
MIGAGALAILAVGLAVRLWGIGAEPLWLDEAYSAYAADHGFAFLWQIVPRYETHPPFYYSVLRLWTLVFGNGLLALRALGIVAGIATPFVIALAGREAARLLEWDMSRRRRATFVAFALASVAIPLVDMARQVRPYPLMILVYAGAIVALLRLAHTGSIRSRAFVVYLLLLEAMLWLHNMGPLFAVALTFALGIAVVDRRFDRRDGIRLIVGHAVVALAYLPGLMILLGQASGWVASTWLRFDPAVLGTRLPSLYAAPGWPLLAAFLLAGLAVAACRRSSPGRRLVGMLFVLACLPVLLSVLLSVTVAPVFIARTMTPVAVPALLLFASGTAGCADARRWLGLGGAFALGANMLAVDIQARAARPMQDWYPTVAWLQARFRPGDQIFAYPNEGALPLAYALRDRGMALPTRPIPTAVPSFDEPGGIYPNGTRGVVSLPRARLRAIADESRTRKVPTIWLLRLAAPTYDPGNIFLHELSRGRRIVSLWQDGPIDLIGLRRITPPPAPARNRR